MNRSSKSDAHVTLWSALGQIVPHIESRDTLAVIFSTALRKVVGAGQVAVILQSSPFSDKKISDRDATPYYLRMVGSSSRPSRPYYLEGDLGILSWLYQLRQPLFMQTPWPAESLPEQDELLRLATESLVVIPIPESDPRSSMDTQGGICLFDVPQSLLPPVSELVALASFFSVALHLVACKTAAARQSMEYSIISEVGHSLTSSLSLDDIFEQILTGVRAAIDASDVSVGLIDNATQEIVLEKSLMGPQFELLPTVRLKMGQGVAGWVAQTGEPVNVPDAYQDERFFPGVDKASGFITHSILCVPLKVEGEVIGILEAVNKKGGNFTEGDERLFAAMGASAAVAIEKAHLHADVLAEKRRMDTIFANMGDGLMTISPAGQITTINPALQRMLRAFNQGLEGKDCREVIRTEPEVLESLLNQLEATCETREPFHAACDILRDDAGPLPVLINGVPITDSAGAPSEIVVVFSDIGQIREVERMKDDFIANVTHELRTPLATILLYARLLKSGKTKNDPTREARYLQIVEEQSNHLQKLVRKILDLSRMEATLSYPGKEWVFIDAFLDGFLPPLIKLADQKGLGVIAEIEPDLPAIECNPEALHLILKNLVDNAIKFTPDGQIRIIVTGLDGRVQIEISDEGIGIPPEAIPHLFKRFYRTKTAVEQGIGGTGLGLALVKETVEKLGWEIAVDSRVGVGSTFIVQIPIASPRAKTEVQDDRGTSQSGIG